MQDELRQLAIEEERESLIMESMLWEKVEAGEIDMESFERMTKQMRLFGVSIL